MQAKTPCHCGRLEPADRPTGILCFVIENSFERAPLITGTGPIANADTAGTGRIFPAGSLAHRRSNAGAHRKSAQTSTTIRLDSAPWSLAGSAATIGRRADSVASQAPRQPGRPLAT